MIDVDYNEYKETIAENMKLIRENHRLKRELEDKLHETHPFLVENGIICDKNKEIERLNKKIEQYENPEDMTLMFMWCDEKAKDEIKRLNNIINRTIKYVESLSSKGRGCDIYEDIKQEILKELKGEDKE